MMGIPACAGMTVFMHLHQLGKSFKYAWRGVVRVYGEEQSFRIQLAAALVVVGLMFWLPTSASEKALLLLATMFVLVLELINSIFERVADMMKPRVHHYVEEIKDIMAGTVLIASIGAGLIGVLIFLPYLIP